MRACVRACVHSYAVVCVWGGGGVGGALRACVRACVCVCVCSLVVTLSVLFKTNLDNYFYVCLQ